MTEEEAGKKVVQFSFLKDFFFPTQILIRLQLAICCLVGCWIYVLKVTSFCIDVTTLTEGFAGNVLSLLISLLTSAA